MELKHILTLFVLGLFIFGTTESIFAARYGSSSKGQGSPSSGYPSSRPQAVAAQPTSGSSVVSVANAGQTQITPTQILADFQQTAQDIKRECKDDEQGSACQRHFADMRTRLQDMITHFKKRIDEILLHIADSAISDKDALVDELNAYLGELTQLQTRLQSATTRADLRQIRADFKDLAQRLKDFFKDYRKKLVGYRSDRILQGLDKSLVFLDAMIPRLKQRYGDDAIRNIEEQIIRLKIYAQELRDALQVNDQDKIVETLKASHRLIAEIRQGIHNLQTKRDRNAVLDQPTPVAAVVPTTPQVAVTQ